MAARQQKENYQRVLDQTIEQLTKEGKVPTLLLHSCCAPCSSYVLEYLSKYFKITLLYYNPNISPKEEGKYLPEEFYRAVKGHEEDKEGGERCFICYEQRLREGAIAAKAGGFDYFTTTLSISPLKNAQKLNEIGIRLGEEYGVPYLKSDFKKKNGYKRSVELSAQHHLYRQNYCGCVFSKREAELREQQSKEQ